MCIGNEWEWEIEYGIPQDCFNGSSFLCMAEVAT